MTRLLLSLAGVILLAVVALAVIWLVGQVLVGAGSLAVGTAGVLLKLLWFLVVAALLGGLVYFVANAWRPGHHPERPVQSLPIPQVTPSPTPVKLVGSEAEHVER